MRGPLSYIGRLLRPRGNPRYNKYRKRKSQQYHINKDIWETARHTQDEVWKLRRLVDALAEESGLAVVNDLIVPLKDKERYEKQNRGF